MALVHSAGAAVNIQNVTVPLYTGSGSKIELKNAAGEVLVTSSNLTATLNVFDDIASVVVNPLPAGGGTATIVTLTQATGEVTNGTISAIGGGGDLVPVSGTNVLAAGQIVNINGAQLTQATS